MIARREFFRQVGNLSRKNTKTYREKQERLNALIASRESSSQSKYLVLTSRKESLIYTVKTQAPLAYGLNIVSSPREILIKSKNGYFVEFGRIGKGQNKKIRGYGINDDDKIDCISTYNDLGEQLNHESSYFRGSVLIELLNKMGVETLASGRKLKDVNIQKDTLGITDVNLEKPLFHLCGASTYDFSEKNLDFISAKFFIFDSILEDIFGYVLDRNKTRGEEGLKKNLIRNKRSIDSLFS